ncbi:MAG: membrane protein insertion efficiency factor YidD [Clostridia bacterium]|nr:membrane protein insertion efficiency factor YidD [Clostridia bacterium]
MLIRIYKRYYNPLMKDRCIYTPSCSAYMGQAVRKWGPLGIIMGIMRLLRCVPWKEGGFDPVKDNYRGVAKWIF